MRTFCKIFIVAMGLFLISTSAAAYDSRLHSGFSIKFGGGDNHIRFSYGFNDKHFNHSPHHKYWHRHHFSHKPYYSYKYRYSPFFGYKNFGYKQHNYYGNRHRRDIVKKRCHPVTKVIVDSYGKYRGVAGTMCYDKYGKGYVVRGSRYLRH